MQIYLNFALISAQYFLRSRLPYELLKPVSKLPPNIPNLFIQSGGNHQLFLGWISTAERVSADSVLKHIGKVS